MLVLPLQKAVSEFLVCLDLPLIDSEATWIEKIANSPCGYWCYVDVYLGLTERS